MRLAWTISVVTSVGRTNHLYTALIGVNVWRITAKKRMVAKLKAIKAELQRRKHHRTTEVGAWLRKVVLGYYQYHAVPGNSTQLCIFSRRVVGCGGAF